MTNDDIVGVWRQQSDGVVKPDGTVIEGEPRTSQLIYSRDGYMMVLSMPDGRALLPGSGPQTLLSAVPAEALAEVARGMIAYAGRFEVKDGQIHHIVEIAFNPNLVGHTLTRRSRLDGDDLTLSTEPDAAGTFRQIHWRRVGGM
jgi:hypothetical protein